jgi:hypothetical protein
MIDLTPLASAILMVVIVLVSTYLVPYLRSKLTAEQMENVRKWVIIAVEAAEMIYVGAGRGTEKKKYVMAFLKSKGFTLNPAEIDNLIESAVMELKLLKS